MSEKAEDGRSARRRRTHEAVIDALYDLFSEGNLTPTIQELADRVGLTTRTFYHHFPDRVAVVEALAARQRERHAHLFACRPIKGTRNERIDGIVTHRAELFETVAPVRRAALAVMHSIPALQTQQTNLAARLRRQLTQTFEPELSSLDRAARAQSLDLLDLHTSWETWDRLRTWQDLSADRSHQLVTSLVIRALER